MPRKATLNDIMRIMQDHGRRMEQMLSVTPIMLACPVKGPPRIHASVRPGNSLPATVEFDLDGETIEVVIETTEDYQDMELFGGAALQVAASEEA